MQPSSTSSKFHSKSSDDGSPFQRAFKASSIWPDKTELFDVVHWIRQVLAVLMGFIWGAIPLEGAAGLLSFSVLSTLLTVVYVTKFLAVDLEDLGTNVGELIQEGFMSSFGSFLISWIMIYNLVWF